MLRLQRFVFQLGGRKDQASPRCICTLIFKQLSQAKWAPAGTKIAQLEAKKRVAVEQEDYDLAKELKMEVDKLRCVLCNV